MALTSPANPFLVAEPHICELEIGPAPLTAPLVLTHRHLTPRHLDSKRSFKAQYKRSRRLDFAIAEDGVRRALGMDGRTCQPCPIPEHVGVGWLEEEGDRGLVLRCDCHGVELRWDEGKTDYWHSLGDVYRAVHTATTIAPGQRLKAGLRLVWSLLLAAEAGLLEPEPVPLPPLPPEASDLEHRIAAFYQLLAGLRVADGRELETPLSVTLVMEYCGLTDRGKTNDALQALRSSGVLVGRRAPNSYFEYLPGSSRGHGLLWRPC